VREVRHYVLHFRARTVATSVIQSHQSVPAFRASRRGKTGGKPHEAPAGGGRIRLRADSVCRSGPELSPTPKQGEWIAKDFEFHTGEMMPELRIGYTTVGEPSGRPVLMLHGTGGSANSMLTPAFAGELFGPGQPPRRKGLIECAKF